MRTKDAGRQSGGPGSAKEASNPSHPAIMAGMGGDVFCGNVEQAAYAGILH